jgi:hypothetical protein
MLAKCQIFSWLHAYEILILESSGHSLLGYEADSLEG